MKNKVKKYTLFYNFNLKDIQEQIYAQNPLICYSSVYKRGNTLVVKAEKATSFNGGIDTEKTSLISTCEGEIISLTILRGYPLKAVGDMVKKGEIIVSGQKIEEEKEYNTFVIANAKILCTYVYTSTEKENFALVKAKLICGQEEYTFQEVTKNNDLVTVTLKYVITIGELI